jgi:hypothetical protein
MKRTVTQLPDGWQLIYFDQRGDAARDAVDLRELPPPPAASELQDDPVLDEFPSSSHCVVGAPSDQPLARPAPQPGGGTVLTGGQVRLRVSGVPSTQVAHALFGTLNCRELLWSLPATL